MEEVQTAASPFRVDPDDEVPVGLQLLWRLRALIKAGRLEPGERLPSVRELAEWAAVNVNTVRAVYRRLEEEALVSTQHGAGTFVKASAGPSGTLERIATGALAAAADAGIDARDLLAAIHASAPPRPISPEPPLPAGEASARSGRMLRAELRRQIGFLEAELSALLAEGGSEAHTPGRRSGPPRIADVGELTETRDRLIREVRIARSEEEKRDAARERARARLEAMISDPASHRWDAVTSAELGEPGERVYEAERAHHPLAALMDWWRDHSRRPDEEVD